MLEVDDLPLFIEAESTYKQSTGDWCIVCGSHGILSELLVRHGRLRTQIDFDQSYVRVCAKGDCRTEFMAGLVQIKEADVFTSDCEHCAYCDSHGAGRWVDVVWSLKYRDTFLCRSGNYQVCVRCCPSGPSLEP